MGDGDFHRKEGRSIWARGLGHEGAKKLLSVRVKPVKRVHISGGKIHGRQFILQDSSIQEERHTLNISIFFWEKEKKEKKNSA